jgi:type VI protein secretion system component VasK
MVRSKGEKSERLEVRARFSKIARPVDAHGRELRVDWDSVLQEIWERWLVSGELPEGFEIAISWRNPDNRNPEHADWKQTTVVASEADEGEAEAARVTLNRGGWLSGRLRFKAPKRLRAKR